MTLKRKTFSAVRWTTFSAMFRVGLQLLQLAVLARLLAPADYGLMAMVSVVLGFAGLLADMGANSSFVQKQEVTDAQRTSLYWMNVGVSVALALLLMVASPAIAWVMKEPRLTLLLIVVASTLWITALGQQVRMAAEKQLEFRPVVILEILTALLGFAVAVLMAWAGWGVWALVAGSLTGAIASTVGAWLFMSQGWRPNWYFAWADVRPFLHFGGALVVNHLVSLVNASIDLLLGGRLLGAAQLGLYSLPRNLSLQVSGMINPIITRVGFPMIAKVQHDLPRVRAIYLKTMNMTASINAPIYMGLVFFAPEVVDLMLGSKWQEAIPLLRILAAWALFRSLGNPAGSLLFGMGKAGLALKWNIGLMLPTTLGLWLGIQWGTMGLAWAMMVMMVMLFVPGWYVLIRPVCGAGLLEYAVASLRPMVLAMLAVGCAYLVVSIVNGTVTRLAVGVVIAAPLYVAVSYWMNREWFDAMTQLIGRSQNE